MIIIVRLIKSGITTAELLPLLRPLEPSRVTSEVLTAENTAELNKITSTVKEKDVENLSNHLPLMARLLRKFSHDLMMP